TICIIEQINYNIKVNEFGERISGQVQPDECAIHMFSSASSFSGS
ncbi:10737_t:CDS:2, partial [Cetraspora pellucida]